MRDGTCKHAGQVAVMYVELNYEEPERDRLTMAIMQKALNLLKGRL